MINEDLLAPSGLYCGVSGILIASEENDQKIKERLITVFSIINLFDNSVCTSTI